MAALFQLGDLELRFRLDAAAGRDGPTTVLEGDDSKTGDSGDSGESDEFELEGDWDAAVTRLEPPRPSPSRGQRRSGGGSPSLGGAAAQRE